MAVLVPVIGRNGVNRFGGYPSQPAFFLRFQFEFSGDVTLDAEGACREEGVLYREQFRRAGYNIRSLRMLSFAASSKGWSAWQWRANSSSRKPC